MLVHACVHACVYVVQVLFPPPPGPPSDSFLNPDDLPSSMASVAEMVAIKGGAFAGAAERVSIQSLLPVQCRALSPCVDKHTTTELQGAQEYIPSCELATSNTTSVNPFILLG